MPETAEVDSWRFLPPRLARLLQARIESDPPVSEIPFAPLGSPLREARVALLSTAGISCPPDPPFDMESERNNPMWGDPSWRSISRNSAAGDIEVNHLHIDTSYIRRDLNVALPLARLHELADRGEVGRVASTHYSIMGYQLDPTAQLGSAAPAIAARMREEAVTAAILAPV